MEVSDINVSMRDGAKKVAALYIDNSEKLGLAMLDLHEKSTTWARQTGLEPLFEAQRSAGKQILDNSVVLVRKLFGIEKEELVSRS